MCKKQQAGIARLCNLSCFFLQLIFPGGNAVALLEGTVEAGMIGVTDALAHFFQRHIPGDEPLCLRHPALGYKAVEGGIGPALEQLGHSGNTDAELIRQYLQRNILVQILVHEATDLLQQILLALDSGGAFLHGCLFVHMSDSP